MAGMVLGFTIHIGNWVWLAVILLGFMASFRRDGAMLIVALALGGWLAPSYPESSRLAVIEEGHVFLSEVVVEAVSLRQERQHVTLRFLAGLPDSLGIERGIWRTSRTKLSQCFPGEGPLPGDTLVIAADLAWPRPARNPHGFDDRFYLWTRHVDVGIGDPVEVLDFRPGVGLHTGRYATLVRRWIKGQLNGWLGAERSGVMAGLLLGDKGGIDPHFRRRMTLLGVGHILAVSGLHVGYIVLVLLFMARLVRLRAGQRLVFVAVGLLGYAVLTGLPPSVVRAGLMAVFFLWGRSLERKADPWNLLAAALVISLILDPRTLFTASFQLSFSAVAGILHIYPRLKEVLKNTRMGERLFFRPIPRWSLTLLLVTLGAQLGTLPVTMTYFHGWSIYGLAANLFVVPLAGVAVITCLIALILAAVPPLAAIFANTTWLALAGIEGVVRILTFLPHPQVVTGQPALLTLMLVAVGVAVFPFMFTPQGPRYRARWAALLLVMGNLLVWPAAWKDRALQVTFLDVGQGDAIHLALPDGRQVLVDAGKAWPSLDPWQNITAQYLRGQGLSRLDVAVISHPHDDHLGGLPQILRTVRVGEVWDTENNYRTRTYLDLKSQADSLGVPIRKLEAGDIVTLGPVDIFVLAPDSLQIARVGDQMNNASLVLKINYGRTTLLLMGDTEVAAERRLLVYGAVLRSQWLKVGHHGSRTASTGAFLAAVSPGGSIISAGRGNRYGHPHAETLHRLQQVSQVLHRTDRDGALVIRSDGEHWQVVEWR